MKWIEANIYTTSESVETISALLLEHGVNGFQIEDDEEMKRFLKYNLHKDNYADYIEDELINKENEEVKVKFYVTKDVHGYETINTIKSGLQNLKTMDIGLDLGRLFVELKNVDDQDWENNWKKYYKPFNIGENIVIKPDWENYENKENKVVFNINPGHLFGTGLHQTTQLVIIELEKYINSKSQVLDLGCGTGILSIISLLLGAEEATAVDIEPSVIEIAYKNAEINNVNKEQYTVLTGNILTNEKLYNKLLQKRYNLIVTNIVADVIISLLDFISETLQSGEVFISSGIIVERLDDVYSVLKEKGFTIKDTLYKDNWVCIVSIKD